MDKLFRLKERGTNIHTEFVAGLTTFRTMAYILAVNPGILSDAGMDARAVFTATAVASAIASFCMAFLANLPFALSAGMGLNAFFAYSVVLGYGHSWQLALAAVFVEGIIFVILTLTNVREAIFNAIPAVLKTAVAVGIGLFICLIGMKTANIVVDSPATLVRLFDFKTALADGSFRSTGVAALLAMTGTLITGALVVRNLKGSILFGILATWALGILCELAGLYVPKPEAGLYSVIPSALVSAPASIAPTLFKFELSAPILDFIVIVFAFLFVDIFDTLGTLIGCASKADMLDKDGRLPKIKGALLADSIGTICGACLGTSTITTYVESSAGISQGGRTGLTAVVTGLLFLAALFLSPLFLTVPAFATAPALIVVGFFMVQQVVKIDWLDPLKAIPAFICITSMAFMYSISEGIALGIISYTLLHLLCGKFREVTPLMYILSAVFALKYALI